MIPVSLVLQGVYSYKERQQIEFTPLLNAHLFGIFGGVGSGKSTILEAISYALYGQTERLSKRDDQKYNMMNLSSDDLFIEFIFRAGERHEDEYKFTVTGKRNSRRFEEVKKFERKAYCKEAGGWMPLETDDAESILGISYDNFKRTIIIPQGMFQEFIQLEPSKRTVMLMELFNLQKYDLSAKVSILETRNISNINQLKGRISQLSDDSTPEQIQALETQLKLLTPQLIEKTKEQNLLSEANNLQNSLQSLATQFQEVDKKLNAIELQKEYFTKKEEQIKQYDLCVQNFKDILAQYNERKKTVTSHAGILEQLRKDQISSQKEQETLKEKLVAVEASYLRRDQNREKTEDLTRLLEINKLDTKLYSGNLEFDKLNLKLRDMDKAVAELKAKVETAEKGVRDLRQKQPDIALLSQIQQWFTEQKHFQGNLKSIKDDLSKNENKLKELETQKEQLLSSPGMSTFITKEQHQLKINAITLIVESKLLELRNSIKDMDEKLGELSGSERLVEYVRRVQKGKPCPLCGALEHPQILKIEDVSEAKKQLSLEKQNTSATINLISANIGNLNKLYVFFKTEYEAKKLKEEQVKALESQIKTHLEAFIWSGYTNNDEQKLKTEFVTASKQKQEISDQENGLEKLRLQLETDRELLEKNRKQTETVKTSNLQFLSQKDTLVKQMKHLKLESYQQVSLPLIQKEKDELINVIQTVEASFKTITEQVKELHDKLHKLTVQCSEKEAQLKQSQQEYQQTEAIISERMNTNNYKSIEAISDILKQNLNSAKENQEITYYQTERLSKQTEKATLEKQLQGKSYDKEIHQQLKLQLGNISGVVGSITKETIELGGKLNRLKSNLEKQAKLLGELKLLELRATNLATLKVMFIGKKFVDFISTQYLQNLTLAANERFSKLTRQQLKLEVNDTNDFVIRDLLNEGKTRSIKTLSGGQTFQAALSLALTLADQVNKRAGLNQNFFFMDEGFGSLDRESLRVVFDSLKSLHKENRVVGVISHVEDMQQDMDVYLKITKDDKRGSVVAKSWE